MPTFVTRAAVPPNSEVPGEVVLLRLGRALLAKRRWRASADDGREFACVVESPLRHGDYLAVEEGRSWRIEQEEEPLLEIALRLAPSAAAGVGWAVGNLHLELMGEADRLLTPDEPAARQLLDRIQISYTSVRARFRPGRFARGETSTHELGSSHRH